MPRRVLQIERRCQYRRGSPSIHFRLVSFLAGNGLGLSHLRPRSLETSDMTPIGPLELEIDIERWALASPLCITGYEFEAVEVLIVRLISGSQVGRGEAAGVYYRNDTPTTMRRQIESVRPEIEAGLSWESLQPLLPAGGARNAVDCALWDLQAKVTGRPVWQLAELNEPHALLTTATCGAETPEKMATRALEFSTARAIKLKLTGDPVDGQRVRAVREARPDVWLGVDANQGFTLPFLQHLLPELVQSHVSLIEQPFAVGQEALLDGFHSPIPIAADESVQTLADLASLRGRFNVVNIKLDKCGGLTEGLAMARAARRLGMGTMVGNMLGTSLAMAPAFLVGQLCEVVDLDGPLLLRNDRTSAAQYEDGLINCSEVLWGGKQCLGACSR